MKNTKLQNPSLRKRKGFTLIELIVVIAILAILAAIAIPTFLGQLNRARISAHNANVMTLRSAAAVALAENGAPTTANVVWLTTTTGTGNTGAWAATKYIDTWPTPPAGLTYTASTTATTTTSYSVVITTAGAIDVSPIKIAMP